MKVIIIGGVARGASCAARFSHWTSMEGGFLLDVRKPFELALRRIFVCLQGAERAHSCAM